MRHRVFAFIVRDGANKELLVFDHLGYPEAGVQVPGGGIETDEHPDQAILREVREESGIERVAILAKLSPIDMPHWRLIAHPYLLKPTIHLPEYWDFTTNDYHDIGAKERDEPLIFSYRWAQIPLIIKLQQPQVDWLDELLAKR